MLRGLDESDIWYQSSCMQRSALNAQQTSIEVQPQDPIILADEQYRNSRSSRSLIFLLLRGGRIAFQISENMEISDNAQVTVKLGLFSSCFGHPVSESWEHLASTTTCSWFRNMVKTSFFIQVLHLV